MTYQWHHPSALNPEVEAHGIFLAFFPDDFQRRERFYMFQWTDLHPPGVKQQGWESLDQVVASFTVGPPPGALMFSAVRGQAPEQVAADTRACQQMAEQAPAAYDQLIRPPYRNIEPRALRVQINCMTGLGYLAFMTHGQTLDQYKAEVQVCVPAPLKAKKTLSDDDISGIADCMLGRGYSVAGPNFARGPR